MCGYCSRPIGIGADAQVMGGLTFHEECCKPTAVNVTNTQVHADQLIEVLWKIEVHLGNLAETMHHWENEG